jgi:phage terminase large subunit
MQNFNKTWLFDEMLNHFLSEYKKRNKARIISLGGTRSGKTIQTAILLLFIADKYKITKKKRKDSNQEDSILDVNGNLDLIIDVYRNELVNTRKTYDDFVMTLGILGIKKNVEYSSPNANRPWIKLPNGNTIYFNGLPADGSEVQAAASHMVYFNEVLEVQNQKTIKNIIMRCELMVIYDSNPSSTSHFIFDMIDKDNRVLYLHSTYRDNPYLPQQSIDEIEESCPWDLDCYVLNKKTNKWEWLLPEHERPINKKNEENGTIDRQRWIIFGEGQRCAREGSAFSPIWISEFPEDVTFDVIGYGLDFGFTSDETAFVRVGLSGRNIYAKLLFYEAIQKKNQNIDDVLEYLHERLSKIMKDEFKGILKGVTKKIPIVCESQDQREGVSFVSALQNMNIKNKEKRYVFCKVKKYKFKIWAVDLINRFVLHVVKTRITEKELINFVFEEKNGELTSILHGVKGRNNYDHFIDALMYFCWEVLRYFVNKKTK